MSSHASNHARVVPLRPVPAEPPEPAVPPGTPETTGTTGTTGARGQAEEPTDPARREPLWRDVVGDALRRERLAQRRTLKDVADAARISMPYLSELERGRKEASSEVLAAAAHALGLGLADLLALTHRRLVRPAPPRPLLSRTATAPGRAEARSRSGDIRLAA